MNSKRFDIANDILKEALVTAQKNVELRALYTYYMVKSKQNEKLSRAFAEATIKESVGGRYDTYALCAIGILLFNAAREIRPASTEQAKDKASKNVRAAEFFDRALQQDPNCAVAAQGIAIVMAEDALHQGALSSTADPTQRSRNFRDAVNILAKVRDTIADGSVYVNLGNVHAAREEWEKAIENVSSKDTLSRTLLTISISPV